MYLLEQKEPLFIYSLNICPRVSGLKRGGQGSSRRVGVTEENTSDEDTLEEALAQEHHRWPAGTLRVRGGVASGM